jgi:hypothetical protein
MFDILTYLLSVVSQDKKTDETHPKIHSWVLNKDSLAQIAEEFCTHPISKCVGISKRNPFAAISTHAKVAHLVYFFKKDLHRVAVVDKTEIVNVVSQSTLIQFLAKHVTQTHWVNNSTCGHLTFLVNSNIRIC